MQTYFPADGSPTLSGGSKTRERETTRCCDLGGELPWVPNYIPTAPHRTRSVALALEKSKSLCKDLIVLFYKVITLSLSSPFAGLAKGKQREFRPRSGNSLRQE